MAISLTKNEASAYAREKKYALMMFANASSDYLGCRCCILNGLSSGFALAAQTIEKLLKAFIYLATGEKTTLRAKDRHNPYLLKQELVSTYTSIKLDGYDQLLRKLYSHYQSRYFDNVDAGGGASSEELPEIDDLFLFLVDALPIPDEVKYRCVFFGQICDENARRYWQWHHWATKQNRALEPRMQSIERRYREVLANDA